MRLPPGARIALALLIPPLAILSPALSQSPPVPAAVASTGFAPFTATFQPNLSSGSLYQWQFDYVAGGAFVPDYTSESPSDVSFTYQREGDYVARLRIYDTDTGLPTDYDVPITVYPPPVPPTVSIAGSDPHYAGVGVPATFSATAVASAGLVVASYHWEFLGDGVTSATSPGAPSATATFTYAAPGSYTVKVTAIDNAGLAGFATFAVQVIRPPTVTLPAPRGDILSTFAVRPGPETTTRGVAFRDVPFPMTALATADTGRSIAEYRWDFDGDGTIDHVQPGNAGSDTQSFAYPLAGIYQARVTVVDDAGIPGTATYGIRVFLVHLSVDAAFAGDPSQFTATTYASPGVLVTGYDWDFGDGTTATTGPAENPTTHVYTLHSWWVATVTAHFNDGSSDTSPVAIFGTQRIVRSDDFPPTIASLSVPASLTAPTDMTVRVGREVEFSALAYAGSGPNGNAALTQVAWDFDGDGLRDYIEDFSALQLLQATSSPRFQYQYPGVYKVQVVAGTSYGQTMSQSFQVTVAQGTPPVECWIVQPATGKKVGGNHVTLSARGSPGNHIASVTFQVRPKGALLWSTIAKVVPPPATALSTSWNTTRVAPGLYDLQAVVAALDGSTATSWSIQPVTVSVNRSVTADEEETADANGIPQVRIHTVDPSRGDRSEISQDTRVEFPPHSTTATGSSYARCRIERLAADPHPIETRFQGIIFVPGLFRRLDLGSDALTSPARLSLYVPPAGVNQALAQASLNRSAVKDLELTIYRFDNATTHSWVPLFSHVRQPSEDLVRASMVAMGDVGVGFQAGAVANRDPAGSGSWSGCGALGLEALLPLLLLGGIRRRR